MRKKEDHLEKDATELSVQNRRLADLLQKARDDMAEMQKQLANHDRDRQTLAVSFHLTSSPSLAPSGLRTEGASARCLLRPRAGLGP